MRLPLAAGFLLLAGGAALAQDQNPAQKKPKAPPAPWQDFCCYEKGRVIRDGMVTIVYEFSHPVAEFEKMLKPYLTKEKGRIEHSEALKTFAVTDTEEQIGRIEQMLKIIHVADAPVMIEARVVELRWDSDLQIGIEGALDASGTIWSAPASSGAAFRSAGARFNPTDAITGAGLFQGSSFRFSRSSAHQGDFAATIQAFVERGRAQILSQPRILVRANKTAKIFTGDQIPYPSNLQLTGSVSKLTYTFKEAGVRLEVTPHIAAPGEVALKLKPEVSTTFGFIDIGGVLAPQFTVRSVETELVMRDGEEVVIGGLFRRDKQTVRRGLPFLSDIPLLGYLFGKYEESEIIQEVLFFIKPTILKSREELPREIVVPEK